MDERDDSVLGFCVGCGHDITAWRAARAQDAERIGDLRRSLAMANQFYREVLGKVAALEREQEALKREMRVLEDAARDLLDSLSADWNDPAYATARSLLRALTTPAQPSDSAPPEGREGDPHAP
jgi:hypothetical protein